MAKTSQKKECNEIGCHITTIGRYCEKHKGLEKLKTRSGASSKPYNNPAYKTVRARILTLWPLCHICKMRPSVIVDHVDNDPTNNRLDNLKGACNPCNTRKGYYHNKNNRK